MSIELLGGFKWDSDEAHREIDITLDVADLFILSALNQDYGIVSKYIPKEKALDLQQKLIGALRE